MHRRRRTRGAGSAKLFGYCAFIAASLGSLAYGAMQLYGQPTPDHLGCYESAHKERHVVFVDASEPRFNAPQRRSLLAHFEGVWERLGFNERLSFITTEGNAVSSIVRPSFEICGPARASAELEEIGAASADSGFLRKQRARSYQKRFAPYIKALFTEDIADARRQSQQSPILESIQAISRMDGLGPGSQITIVSDLLQSSDSARFCTARGHMPSYAAWKKRTIYQRLKPERLDGLKVTVLFVQRHGIGSGGLRYCSGEEELRRFFAAYFRDHGAEAAFIRIRTGNIPQG